MNCPGFERLIDYLDGRMDAALIETEAAHLALGCRRCEADRRWYEEARAVAASDDSVEPPPWVLKRALKLFENARPRESAPARIRRLVASLIFDNFERPAMAGARLAASDDHQMLYQAGDYNIDLQVSISGDSTFDLTGQILKEGEFMFESVSGIELMLIREGETVHSTVTSEIGEFFIPAVESDHYEMQIKVGEITITIVALNIL